MSVARALRRLARAAGVVLLLLAALVGVTLASLDTRPMRAFVAGEVNTVLAGTFKGKIVVRRIAHLGPGSARGVEATLLDPAGVRGRSKHRRLRRDRHGRFDPAPSSFTGAGR